ncbi:hypothetical protein evm_014948, partial [Chilo suppressalis]
FLSHCNLCLGVCGPQLDALLSAGFLEPYCALLHAPDHRAITVVLDGLTNLLQAAVKYGQVEALCFKLEEIGALDQIELLQQHENVDNIDTVFVAGKQLEKAEGDTHISDRILLATRIKVPNRDASPDPCKQPLLLATAQRSGHLENTTLAPFGDKILPQDENIRDFV